MRVLRSDSGLRTELLGLLDKILRRNDPHTKQNNKSASSRQEFHKSFFPFLCACIPKKNLGYVRGVLLWRKYRTTGPDTLPAILHKMGRLTLCKLHEKIYQNE
jgi:hypothetical protein